VEVHQQAADSSDIVLGAKLSMTQSLDPNSQAPFVISEISGTGEADFRVEIANLSGSTEKQAPPAPPNSKESIK